MIPRSTVVVSLIDKWERAKVVNCHWKSTDHIEEAFCGLTDLDVLVDVKDASHAEQIAMSCGFIPMQTAEFRRYPSVYDFIAYDSVLNLFIHLHLHYQLVLGDRWVKAYRLPIESGVLHRRVWLNDYATWIISPVDELVIFCARMCAKFDRPFGSEKIMQEASFLVSRLGADNDFAQIDGEYPGPLISLAKTVIKNSIAAGAGQILKVKKEMHLYRRMSLFRFFFLSKLRLGYRVIVELVRRKLKVFIFGRRRLPRGGVTVAFVGMDGSGKTSAIARNSLFFSNQMDVATVFLGSGKSGAPWYRRIVFNFFGTKAKFKNRQGSVEGSRHRKKYPIYYLLWHWLCLSDRIRRIKTVFRNRTSGVLVLVDRWLQDTIPGSLDGPKMNPDFVDSLFSPSVKKAELYTYRLARRFPPDLVLRFVVSPSVSRMRKPGDLSKVQAEQAKKDLLTIVWPPYCDVVDINADESIEVVDANIRKAIWSKIIGAI